MYQPNFKGFKKLARKGNLVCIWQDVPADLDTPVSAFYKVVDPLDREKKYAFLLESVEKGTKVGRFSFLSVAPFLVFESKGNLIRIKYFSGRSREVTKSTTNPLEDLRQFMKVYQPVPQPDLPRFYGGAVGFVGYETVQFFEKIPRSNFDELNMPDLLFIFTDTLLVFDHLKHSIKVIASVRLEKETNREIAYRRACQKIENIVRNLNQLPGTKKGMKFAPPGAKAKSNFTRAKFMKAVLKTKKYIRKGDIIQAVISQRWKMKIKTDAFQIYRALRRVNPSPYMFYLQFGDINLIGSSPELLVRLEGRWAEERPIAGTRPRGEDEERDRRLEKLLQKSTKERAEHIMLVDLARNDLGRVCEYGSVRVEELLQVEKYSHVQHLVSAVTGKLKRRLDAFDVFKACFPAGTVTGAPKIRAMEIINELEPSCRGPYAGAVGYFGFQGNMDTCIIIRTIIVKGNQAWIQAGAGIVADSNPEREYMETVNKSEALRKAIEIAG